MKTKLKTDEKIILEVQLHWFTLVAPFLIGTALVVGGIFLIPFGLILSAAGALLILYKLIERKNNLWTVTNFRIVDEKGVLSNNSKESPLDKINNVAYHQSFWGKIFNYGNVEIQTAAEIGATTYSMLENPARLKDTITQMQEEYKQLQARKQAQEMANAMKAASQPPTVDIKEELEKIFELKMKGILTEEEYNAQKAKILSR
jgi:uncharacterized membrane protein YdbT with pleckstrin-like domain